MIINLVILLASVSFFVHFGPTDPLDVQNQTSRHVDVFVQHLRPLEVAVHVLQRVRDQVVPRVHHQQHVARVRGRDWPGKDELGGPEVGRGALGVKCEAVA